ncbi:hypothetical protein KIPB_017300, partial [Kipferlia bialata]|eukprot:g17300.t1
MLLLSNVLE